MTESSKPTPATVAEVMAQLAEAARAEPQLTSRQRRARTVARLAAVQALYQMELAGEGVDVIVKEFRDHRFDGDIDGTPWPRRMRNGSPKSFTAWSRTSAALTTRSRRVWPPTGVWNVWTPRFAPCCAAAPGN